MEIQKLSQLYKQVTGEDPVSVVEMPSSGSNRRYFRLSGVQSLVGAVGTLCRGESCLHFNCATFC